MAFQISIYDRNGLGLRLPEGWWLDLGTASPAVVKGALRVELPESVRSTHPRLQPEVLQALHGRIEGAQWLT